MDDATPIFALKSDEPNIRKQPLEVMSYSDVLRSMDSTAAPHQPTTPPPPPIPPKPPVVEPAPFVAEPAIMYNPSAITHQPPAPQPPAENATKPDLKQFQNEMLILLVSYIVIHMSTVQAWIATKIPNIVNTETGTMSVLGLLTNGILLIVLWNVAKRLVLKYMQESIEF